MRKSKFDWFIFYDPKQDRILEAQWDHAVDRVPEWFIFDGARARYIRGHGVIKKLSKWYVLLDRLPEGYGRAR